jgi:hypothetical protein
MVFSPQPQTQDCHPISSSVPVYDDQQICILILILKCVPNEASFLKRPAGPSEGYSSLVKELAPRLTTYLSPSLKDEDQCCPGCSESPGKQRPQEGLNNRVKVGYHQGNSGFGKWSFNYYACEHAQLYVPVFF